MAVNAFDRCVRCVGRPVRVKKLMLKTAKDSKRAGTVLLTLKKGVITRSVYKFWFNHIYENGEDRHFKFRLLIDAQKC